MRHLRMVGAGFAVVVGLLAVNVMPAQAVPVGPGTGGGIAGQAGCEVVLISPLFTPPASCTFFDGASSQTPRGSWQVRSVSLRTGARTGPVRFTMVQALRSQAGTQGIICCTASAQSRVFTPAPNQVTTIPVNMRAVNTVEVIDRERVEVVDYLGISLLNRNSAIAFRGSQLPSTTYFVPAFSTGATQLPGSLGHSVVPMISANLVACRGTRAGATRSDATVSAGCRGGFSVAARTPLSRDGTRARLRVNVPRRGRLVVRGAGRSGRLIARTSRNVSRAGSTSIIARLSRPGRRALARNGRVRVVLNVTFRPVQGKAQSRRLAVRFVRRR